MCLVSKGMKVPCGMEVVDVAVVGFVRRVGLIGFIALFYFDGLGRNGAGDILARGRSPGSSFSLPRSILIGPAQYLDPVQYFV